MTKLNTIAEQPSFDIELHEADKPLACLILGHGAGAGKEHEFMQDIAKELVARGISTVLFNFPYMQTIKATGKRRPPDKADKPFCDSPQHPHDAATGEHAGTRTGGVRTQ